MSAVREALSEVVYSAADQIKRHVDAEMAVRVLLTQASAMSIHTGHPTRFHQVISDLVDDIIVYDNRPEDEVYLAMRNQQEKGLAYPLTGESDEDATPFHRLYHHDRPIPNGGRVAG